MTVDEQNDVDEQRYIRQVEKYEEIMKDEEERGGSKT